MDVSGSYMKPPYKAERCKCDSWHVFLHDYERSQMKPKPGCLVLALYGNKCISDNMSSFTYSQRVVSIGFTGWQVALI